jgi:drug/metabolite transporter (DMT)-like permease
VQNAVFILLIGLGWGLLGPGSKALFAAEPGTFDGITVAVARAAWALPVCLIALGIAWRMSPPQLDARRWVAVVMAGVLFGPFITVIFSVAAQHTSVAHISFLYGLSPAVNSALAALVFRTGLDRRAVIALVLGCAGVVLLAATHSSDKSAFFGDVLMVFWLLAFGVYACFLRFVGVAIKPPVLMALVGTIAMAALLVPGVALGYGGAIAHVADSSPVAWWFFGEVLLGSTLIAQPAYAAAVRRLGVALATIGAEYTALAVGVVASLVAHEPWTPLTVIGGLILCCALAVTFAPVPGLAAPLRRVA